MKQTVANRLRGEIASGTLRPGMRIVEGTWARRLGVAQASIREAINQLAQDGFVSKEAGRSARVVSLSEQDVLQIYELRGAVEGLAARLLTQRGGDISYLENALQRMREALNNDRPEDMLDADLSFHLELCRLSGNTHLLDHARKLLIPLFAFARIRVLTSGQDASVWGKDIEAHQRIIDLVKDGQGEISEHYVHHAMFRFAQSSYDNWEKKSATEGRRYSSSRRSGKGGEASHDSPPQPSDI